jgi:hypothetical protein
MQVRLNLLKSIVFFLEARLQPWGRLEQFTQMRVGTDPIYSATVIVKTAFRTSLQIGAALGNYTDKSDLTRSICEEALTRFSNSDDSLAGIIEQYSINVRDFMLLSLVCDQGSFDIDQLGRAFGLTRKSAGEAIARLTGAGLVKQKGAQVQTTVAGRVLSRRILDDIG